MSQGELHDKLVIEAEQLTISPNLQVKKMEITDAKWLTTDYYEGGEKQVSRLLWFLLLLQFTGDLLFALFAWIARTAPLSGFFVC